MPATAPTYRLTIQQQHVLYLAACGHTNSEIARRLHLGQETAKKELSLAIRAVGARNRTQAAAIATRRGLIPGPDLVGPALPPRPADNSLHALIDRWTGRAPHALLGELRTIAGPRQAQEAS